MSKQNTYRLRTVTYTLLMVFALLALITLGLIRAYDRTASAAPSTYLNFQARLKTSSGSVVPDGNYNIEFKLYDASSSSGSSQGACTGDANCLWTETRTGGDRVRVANGYLTVSLGSLTAFPSNMNWGDQLWLTMRIGGSGAPSWDTEMSPRLLMTAVPLAFKANNVGSGNTSTASTNSDGVTVQSGNATGATSNSGNVTIDSGTATGTAGTISLGATNASSLILGRSGLTTLNNGSLTVAQNLTVDTDTLFVDSSTNRVGIGNAAPNAPLHVTSTTAGSVVTQLQLTNSATSSGTGTAIVFNNSTNSAVVNARISSQRTASPDGDLRFWTNDGSGITEKLRIEGDGDIVADTDTLFVDAAGNRVGVGDATPETVLHVKQADPFVTIQDTDTSTSTAQAFMRFAESDGSGNVDNYWQIGATAANSAFDFLIQSSTSSNIFTANRTNGNVAFGSAPTGARVSISGGQNSPAWGTSGTQLRVGSGTFTDTSTAASGTATNAVMSSFAQQTLAATNASVTTTNAATVYVQGAPVAGSNQTITNAYSLWVDDGAVRLDGTLTVAGQVTIGTSDTTGTLLVLDTKTDAGDPTGVEGGIYYNDNSNKFRCYEGAAWVDCISAGGSSLFTDGGTATYLTATSDELVLGSNSQVLGAKLAVIGTSDQEQLLIRANATQSNSQPLIKVTASDDSELFRLHSPEDNSIFLGREAGASVSSGAANTGMGWFSLGQVTTGQENSAFGNASGYSITGTGNTAIGAYALQTGSGAGNYNTALGYQALYQASGGNNVGLGSQAGDNITSGSNNIIIGAGQDAASATGSNQLNIAGAIQSSDYTTGAISIQGDLDIGVNQDGDGILNIYGTDGEAAKLSVLNAFGGTTLYIESEGISNELVQFRDCCNAVFSVMGTGVASIFNYGLDVVGGDLTVGTSDTTGTLLVLDTKTDTGDPTGVNGGMYYNSNAGKFRCYQASAWVDCIASGGGGANTALSNLASTAINVSLLPGTDDSIDLGDNTHRFRDLYLGGETIHLGTSTSDEVTLGYNTTTNSTILKNTTNSTTAFQFQNSSSASLLTIDSTNSGNITLLGNLGGETQAWTTNSNNLNTATSNAGGVVANGYVYIVGGENASGTVVGTVQYAKINANGSIGTWSTTTSLPGGDVRSAGAIVYANGYIYYFGGYASCCNAEDDVYVAKVNADGTITSWTKYTAAMSGTIGNLSSMGYTVANGYAYLVGGDSTGTSSAVTTSYYVKLNPDGTFGAFTVGPNFPSNVLRTGINVTTANGFLYAAGGADSGQVFRTEVYYATLNPVTGAIGAWSTESDAMPATRGYSGIFVSNGYMYLAGGASGGFIDQDDVYYTRLNTDGSTGAWSTSGFLIPANRTAPTAITYNGYMYFMGGWNGSGGHNEIYYTSGPRVQIGGNLDLVGLQGGVDTASNASSYGGSIGGSITAGNITAIGALQIQGNAGFAQNVDITGSLAVTGTLAVGTSDTTGTLLILDTKTDSGDPTGINGGIYYNSNAGKFRCYQASAWTDCIGSGSSLFTDAGNVTYLTATGDQLSIGSSSDLNGKLQVVNDDTADSVVLLRAAASQDTLAVPFLLAQNSAGTEQFRLTGNGRSIYLGYLTGQSDDGTNNDNVGVGNFSMNNVTTGEYNSAVGHAAGGSLNTGYRNSILGAFALEDATDGYENVAVGHGVLGNNVSGHGNVAVGAYAMQTGTSGNFNNAFGVGALALATGSGNIGLGFNAGDNITSGSNNIVIGHSLDAASATASNQLNIAGLLTSSNYTTGGTWNGTLTVTGTATIGASDATGTLLVVDTDTDAAYSAGSATNSTAVTDGGMFYSTINHTFMCGVSGSWQTCTGLLYSNTSVPSQVNSCTTACTNLGAAPIPANYCKPGRVININAQGVFGTHSTGTLTLAMEIRYGTSGTRLSNTLIGTATPTFTVAASLSSEPWDVEFTIICQSTTSMHGSGTFTFRNSNTTTISSTVLHFEPAATGSLTTTAAANIYLFPVWGASQANNSITGHQYVVDGM